MMEHGEFDFDQLQGTLRVEHLGYYLASSNVSVPSGGISIH
jgi:hypothetical protein